MTVHVEAAFEHTLASYAVVTTAHARRLVVFVHGWRGSANATWGGFDLPPDHPWWNESDLLFVEYPSNSESVDATATRLRMHLPDFYPTPHAGMTMADDVTVRQNATEAYRELVLVGHSLGGLVVRRAVVDALDEWRHKKYEVALRPVILDAVLRLFSPASAGFLPRGILGALQSTPTWWALDMFLQRGAYPDLKPGSATIVKTQERTEAYGIGDSRARSLYASILWANPEKVVATERYDTDFATRVADGTTHGSVCKPSPEYFKPFDFVRTGSLL